MGKIVLEELTDAYKHMGRAISVLLGIARGSYNRTQAAEVALNALRHLKKSLRETADAEEKIRQKFVLEDKAERLSEFLTKELKKIEA